MVMVAVPTGLSVVNTVSMLSQVSIREAISNPRWRSSSNWAVLSKSSNTTLPILPYPSCTIFFVIAPIGFQV